MVDIPSYPQTLPYKWWNWHDNYDAEASPDPKWVEVSDAEKPPSESATQKTQSLCSKGEDDEDIVRDELGAPTIVDWSTFQAELDASRAREKAHTKLLRTAAYEA